MMVKLLKGRIFYFNEVGRSYIFIEKNGGVDET